MLEGGQGLIVARNCLILRMSVESTTTRIDERLESFKTFDSANNTFT